MARLWCSWATRQGAFVECLSSRLSTLYNIQGTPSPLLLNSVGLLVVSTESSPHLPLLSFHHLRSAPKLKMTALSSNRAGEAARHVESLGRSHGICKSCTKMLRASQGCLERERRLLCHFPRHYVEIQGRFEPRVTAFAACLLNVLE